MIDEKTLPPGTRRMVVRHLGIDDVEEVLADADRLIRPYVDAMEPAGHDQLRIQVIGLLAGRQVNIVPDEHQSEILRAVPLPGGVRIQ